MTDSLSRPPAVTVLVTVYNGAPWVAESMQSVLAQTSADFELLVIDDASTDDSLAVIRGFDDPRIHVIEQPTNRGIHATLNHGLEVARGEFLAILDQDDVAKPERLAVQLAYLREHPSVLVCGTAIEKFGDDTGPSWVRYFHPDDLKIALLFENPICHPSVMMNRRALVRLGLNYPEVPLAEEYAFWVQASRAGQVANLPEPLLRYRTHRRQVSRRRNDRQSQSMQTVIREQLGVLGVVPTGAQLLLHGVLGHAFTPLFALDRRLADWISRLIAANEHARVYDPERLVAQLNQRQRDAVERTTRMLAAMPALQRWRWLLRSTWRFRRAR